MSLIHRLAPVALAVACAAAGCAGAPGPADPSRPSFEFETLDGGIGLAGLSSSALNAERGGGASFTLRATNAAGLKALYCRLRFDPARYQLGTLTPSAAWGDRSQVLSQGIEREPGVADIGIVLAHYDRRGGISGSADLARLELVPLGEDRQPTEQQPQLAQHSTSVTPTTWDYTPEYLSAFPPQPETSFRNAYTIDRHAARLDWTYSQPGDYDQNSEVGISDLTALAHHYGEVEDPANPWDPDAIQSVLDGDDNGEIGLSDIVPLGRNYGNAVEAWDLYYKDDVLDNDYAGAASLGTVPFAAAVGDPALERIRFSLALADILPSPLYRLVATANGVQATAGAIPDEPAEHPVRYYFVPPGGLNWYGLTWNSAESILEHASAVPGDGDGNNQVNIADLTPLGRYFMRTWDNPVDGPFSPVWYSDYTRDGQCDLLDMEIIGFNWLAGADGFLFYATSDPAELPEPYSYPLLDPVDPASVQSGQYVWLRPYVGDPSDPINIGAPSQAIQIP